MDERLAKAELVFSRAKAARERRLRREVKPTPEPARLAGELVLSLLFVLVVVVVTITTSTWSKHEGLERTCEDVGRSMGSDVPW